MAPSTSVSSAPRPPVLTAAAWVASLERSLEPLRPARRGRTIHHGERVAHRPGLEGSPRAPYLQDHRGTPLIGPERCPHQARARSSASLVVVGGMAHDLVRARSFYLSGRKPLALAVHEHPATGPETGLLRGVEIQRLAHGRLPVRVPRVLAAQTVPVDPREVPDGWRHRRLPRRPRVTGLQADVVVEEWLPGTPVRLDDEVAPAELLETVAALWTMEDTCTVSVKAKAVERMGTRFAELVDGGQQWELWPAEVDPGTWAGASRPCSTQS